MSELLMFIGLSIFMIVLFILLAIGVILISPFVECKYMNNYSYRK